MHLDLRLWCLIFSKHTVLQLVLKNNFFLFSLSYDLYFTVNGCIEKKLSSNFNSLLKVKSNHSYYSYIPISCPNLTLSVV